MAEADRVRHRDRLPQRPVSGGERRDAETADELEAALAGLARGGQLRRRGRPLHAVVRMSPSSSAMPARAASASARRSRTVEEARRHGGARGRDRRAARRRQDDALHRADAGGAEVTYGKTNVGMAEIADPRLDGARGGRLARKVTPATIRVSDVPGTGPALLGNLRQVDALLAVLDGFSPGADPAADLESLKLELLVADRDHVDRPARAGRKAGEVGRSEAPCRGRGAPRRSSRRSRRARRSPRWPGQLPASSSR